MCLRTRQGSQAQTLLAFRRELRCEYSGPGEERPPDTGQSNPRNSYVSSIMLVPLRLLELSCYPKTCSPMLGKLERSLSN